MSRAGWKLTTLGQFCEVFSGYPFKSIGFTDDPNDIPLVKGENIGQGEVLWDISKRWPIQDLAELERYKLIKGDVVLAMDRPWVPAGLKFAKITASAPDALLVQRVARLRGRKGLDQSFLAQLIASPSFVGYVQSVGRGVGVPHISSKEIGAFTFWLPPLMEQEKIGNTLSAYDDLIDNNRRRMALLEDSARQLYREWFVRLRFPGHEHTPIVDGVPQGWSIGTVSDFYETSSGGTPSRKNPEYFTGDIPWVKTQELSNGFITETSEQITDDALKNSSAKLFPTRTVLVALYGATVGELGITAFTAATNQACCAVLKKDPRGHFAHAFLFFRENKDVLVSLSAGAAQKNISQQIVRGVPMLMPANALMSMFTEIVSPVFDQILNLQLTNQKLRQARDLLLPRLMNGELAV